MGNRACQISWMMGGTKVDFLHHAPALRGLLKEPPYLWQPLSPDGGNLEHWAGGMERWWKREREREGGMEDEREGRGREGGNMSNSRRNPSPAEKNKWLEGTICCCLCALPVSPGRTDL